MTGIHSLWETVLRLFHFILVTFRSFHFEDVSLLYFPILFSSSWKQTTQSIFLSLGTSQELDYSEFAGILLQAVYFQSCFHYQALGLLCYCCSPHPAQCQDLPCSMVWIPSPSLGNVRPSVSEVKYLCLSQPVVIEAFFWQVTTNRISQHEDLKQRGSYFILFSVSHFVMTPPSVCCSVLVSLLWKDNAISSFLLSKDRQHKISLKACMIQ